MVTWPEVMDRRRKRQTERLDLIRRTESRRAWRLSVRYYDMTIMGGWQSHLDDWRGQSYGVWIDRDRSWLKPMLMQAIPLGLLPLGSEGDQWASWKVEFAHQFKRRMKDGRPMGVAYLWWNGHDRPELVKPARLRCCNIEVRINRKFAASGCPEIAGFERNPADA